MFNSDHCFQLKLNLGVMVLVERLRNESFLYTVKGIGTAKHGLNISGRTRKRAFSRGKPI